MKKRTAGRDYAVKLAYSSAITEAAPEEAIKDFRLEYPEEDEETRTFAEELFIKTFGNKISDEAVIRQFLTEKWPYERIGVLEKSILHTAVTELFTGDAPTYAVMDDYVTLAKNYGDDKSASFVNGILDNIRTKFSIERGNERRNKRENGKSAN